MRWRATPIPPTRCSARSSIPGLQPRTANGSAGANQFFGQIESGYRVPVFAPAAASVTPFARLQAATRDPERFQRMGRAQSLGLNVAPQTTNSLRTTLGANLGRRHRRSAASARSTWRCGWAGCTSSPTSTGPSPLRSPARRATASPSTAPRRSAIRRRSASQAGTLVADAVAALPALRRRAQLRRQQSRPQSRRPLHLVGAHHCHFAK